MIGTRAVAMLLVSVALSAAGQTFLKLGLNELSVADKTGVVSFARGAILSWQVWLGLVLFAGSVVLWMVVLASNELSWGYPILGLSYVLVALSGWLVFGEHISSMRAAGILLVIAGAVLVGRS
jgi:multidrug transporter EmrE-like cation transporter